LFGKKRNHKELSMLPFVRVGLELSQTAKQLGSRS